MKYRLNTLFLIILTATLFITGCKQSPDQTGEGITVEEAWARPAGEGRMSAVYFRITNFESSPDTLLGVSSDIASLTEIHESYEQGDGMVGMREARDVLIPATSTVHFEPGGLHVMLIQLTRTLQAGDSFDLALHFRHQGEISVTIPAEQ
ncbi:MAG: copper chaperone PCu(A)C [Balneolaceae bacterium]